MTTVAETSHTFKSTCTASLDWQQVMDRDFPETPMRRLFRSCLGEVACRAKVSLPQAAIGRVDKAVCLVLQGDVEHTEDGFLVGSQSDAASQHTVRGAVCDCKDAAREDIQGWCKHRIAAALYTRATALAASKAKELDAAPVPTPQEVPMQPTESTQAPWQAHEPPFVHSLKWSSDGIEHMTVIRASSEQELWAKVKAVTLLIRAGRERQVEPAARPVTGEVAVPQVAHTTAVPTCPVHGTARMRPSKFGPNKWICSIKEGEAWCNKSWSPAE